MSETIHGYAEGYYGRLLSWQEREALLQVLWRNGQNTYYYAPKEDACHRLHWREPYSATWRERFSRFCHRAKELGIRVVAGVAPGLDFDFGHLNGGLDFIALLEKCQQLRADGAHDLSLLMDDIDADFPERNGGIASEGRAHAMLANRLQETLGEALWVTPRIYANELAGDSPNYLPDFLQSLNPLHTVLYCGTDIVAQRADVTDIRLLAPTSQHRLVLWDNLYANDYCPQRLFVGAWSGRESATHCLLNPTGMPATDHLLLDLMSASHAVSLQDLSSPAGERDRRQASWWTVLSRHGVPDEFRCLAPYFQHPVFNGQAHQSLAVADQCVFDAIETCLWRWKTPLSREWYPFLFNLKLDLLLQAGRLSALRLRKTRLSPLSDILLDDK